MQDINQNGGEILHNALIIYKEAVQYIIDQKGSHARYVLFVDGGDYQTAVESSDLTLQTREQLCKMRNALCEHII